MITRRTLMQTGAAFGATLAMPGIVRAEGKMIRMAHASNEIHPGHILAASFRDALEEVLPGAFNVQIFPNRQLGDDKQNLESAVAGTLEMAMVSGVLIPLVTGRPAYDAWQLPFLVRDYDHFEKLALSPIGRKLQDDLEPAGIIGLATADIGQRHFLSVNSQVRSIGDMKGLKTRICTRQSGNNSALRPSVFLMAKSTGPWKRVLLMPLKSTYPRCWVKTFGKSERTLPSPDITLGMPRTWSRQASGTGAARSWTPVGFRHFGLRKRAGSGRAGRTWGERCRDLRTR